MSSYYDFMRLRRFHGGDYGPTAAGVATTARPGSPEKVAVLIGRLERGEPLFHPDDPVLRDEGRDDKDPVTPAARRNLDFPMRPAYKSA